MEWQPISTAPEEEGRTVLLWCGEHGAHTARWVKVAHEEWVLTNAETKKLQRTEYGYWDHDVAWAATHWMPLPPPPNDRKRD